MIIFTKHAIIRIRERKIKKQDVREALKNPDTKRTASNGVTIFQKNKLEVAGEVIKNKIIVVTVYWI